MIKRVVFVSGICMAGLLFAVNVHAADPPTNEQLYQMILELKENQERLKTEADVARAEAEKAKHELEVTRKELDATQEKLKDTEEKILQTQEVVAETREGLAETEAEMGTGPSSSVVKIPDTPGGWTVMGEAMFMRPSTSELDFAIEDSAGAKIVGPAEVVSVDTDYEPGFRVGAGYGFAGTGVDAKVVWSHLDADFSESAVAPAGGRLQATQSTRGTLQDADSASATVDFDYDVVDLEVGQTFQAGGSSVDVRLFGGVRYANIDQARDIFYEGGDFDRGGPATGVRVSSTIDFVGAGPRIGVGAAWNVGHGFSLFGQTAGSLVVGNFDTSLFETNDSVGTPVAVDVTQDFNTRVIPVAEISLGAGWKRQFSLGLLTLRGGYQLENWFNVVDFPDFTKKPVVQEAFFNSGNTTDMSLDGFFFQGNLGF